MKNRTLLYGEGLFETFRVIRGRRLAFLQDHLDRMADGSAFFGFPFSREKALGALKPALEQIPEDAEARLRLDLLCYGDRGIEKTAYQTDWELLEQPEPDRHRPHQAVKLGYAPFPRLSHSPLVRFKTASYLENSFVLRRARDQGLFDAVFTNERNEITEGSISNVFFLEGRRMVTPPVASGLLPGITRKHIFEIARLLSWTVEERTVLRTGLERFDGVFVTNSVVGVLPVCDFAGRAYSVSESIGALQEGYAKRVEASAIAMETMPD